MSEDAHLALADSLVAEFTRMVARDGGVIRLVSASAAEIHIAYRPGADAGCSDGVCILPEDELQELMNETASRRLPGVSVRVEAERLGG